MMIVRARLEQAMDEIASKTALSDHHPDAREGIASFREKRPARFNRWLEERQAASTG